MWLRILTLIWLCFFHEIINKKVWSIVLLLRLCSELIYIIKIEHMNLFKNLNKWTYRAFTLIWIFKDWFLILFFCLFLMNFFRKMRSILIWCWIMFRKQYTELPDTIVEPNRHSLWSMSRYVKMEQFPILESTSYYELGKGLVCLNYTITSNSEGEKLQSRYC